MPRKKAPAKDKYIGACYIEDVTEYFMKNYIIDWNPGFKLARDIEGVPVLFTPEIGRTVFIISHICKYRHRVEKSKIRKYLYSENKFFCHILEEAYKYLKTMGEASLFHMSAYAAEVAVFCQVHNIPHMQVQAFAAIMVLLDQELTLDKKRSRLYYQKLAKSMDKARIGKAFMDTNALEKIPNSNENHDPTISSLEGSDVIRTKSTLHRPWTLPKNERVNNFQEQSLLCPNAVNCFPSPNILHPLSLSCPSFSASKSTVQGLNCQNFHGARFVSAFRSDFMHKNFIFNSFHQGFPSGLPLPSVRHPSAVQNEFNAFQPHMKVSPVPMSLDFESSFTMTSTNDSTEPCSTLNSNTDVSDRSDTQSSHNPSSISVNKPGFAHSSEKYADDDPMIDVTLSSPEIPVNTTSSSNETSK